MSYRRLRSANPRRIVGPLDAFQAKVARVLGVNVGDSIIMTNVAMILVAFDLGARLGSGTIVSTSAHVRVRQVALVRPAGWGRVGAPSGT